jgi:hypothetical protein
MREGKQNEMQNWKLSTRGQIISNGYISHERKSNNFQYINKKQYSLGEGLEGVSNFDDHHFANVYSVQLHMLSNLRCTKRLPELAERLTRRDLRRSQRCCWKAASYGMLRHAELQTVVS